LYKPSDKEAIEALHVRMEARTIEKLDLPQMDERPVVIALVYEKQGTITHAVFLEAEAEVCALGESALPAKEWDAAGETLLEVCRVYQLRAVRAFVPQEALTEKRGKISPVERILKHFGFEREDSRRMTQFFRWVA
jgi:hypothetical protein